MTVALSNTQAVALIVNMLGGMKIDSDALEWTNDMPVAQAVINGVAQQLGIAGNVDNASLDQAIMFRAALRNIALEDSEIQVLKGISGDLPQSISSLENYRLPSETQREIDHIRIETQLLEQEAELLNLRTQQILESRSTSRDIRSLHDMHSSTKSTNGEATRRIEGLSMQMDGIVADATQAACTLLSSVEPLPCYDYDLSCESINQLYSTHTESLTSNINAAEHSRCSLLVEAGIDADELENLFRRYSPDVNFEDMPLSVQEFYKQEGYIAQMENLSNRMLALDTSCQTNSDILADATRLAGMNHNSITDRDLCIIPDARTEIEASVLRDQTEYLNARGHFLDHAVSAMENSIMEPLDSLLAKVSFGKVIVDETEVLCGVLGEEVQSALETTSSSPALLSVQTSEPRETLPNVQEWEQTLETRLRDYGPGQEGLSNVLKSLNSQSGPFLDAMYRNSPLNTSPPFAYSSHFTNLMEDVRTVTAQLGNETDKLTKEVESGIESRRTQRKLGMFVDQWITAQQVY